MRRRLFALAAGGALVAAMVGVGSAGAATHTVATSYGYGPAHVASHWCNTNGITCTEPYDSWGAMPWYKQAKKDGVDIQSYIGHDEPSLLFYSNKAGSGNRNTWLLRLPKDPPTPPTQHNQGGTWNFELHPAFWFGMVMCDNQSAPNPAYSGATYPNNGCTPDSNKNLYTSLTPSNPKYIGKAPGQAYMEMQFYPPGWVSWPDGNSCTARKWCAALTIDSYSENQNDGVVNNTACLDSVGVEPVNFAFLTKTGKATTAASPANAAKNEVPNLKKDYFMGSGDELQLHMQDTAKGFKVVVHDLTAKTTGSMVASAGNGFASVKFDPSASTCTFLTHGFHPYYSTSTPQTRVWWTAHTYNVGYSDEIGHFEYCNKSSYGTGSQAGAFPCQSGGGFDTNVKEASPQTNGDDYYCFPGPKGTGTASLRIKITGCEGADVDFDGVSYNNDAWPGSIINPTAARLLLPTPIAFRSPITVGGANYSQVAFEADLPRIEYFFTNSSLFGGETSYCNRHIANPPPPSGKPGAGCVNPPGQSRDYPFYVTVDAGKACWWDEVGGTNIPSIADKFTGNSLEYGKLLDERYPTYYGGTQAVEQVYDVFHNTLKNNPCKA